MWANEPDLTPINMLLSDASFLSCANLYQTEVYGVTKIVCLNYLGHEEYVRHEFQARLAITLWPLAWTNVQT